jgi:hypothetical protein
VYNPVLLKFALGLPAAHEDILVQALLVGILRSCPDVIEGYVFVLLMMLPSGRHGPAAPSVCSAS